MTRPRTRLTPSERKAQIVAGALKLAERTHYSRLTYAGVSQWSRCSRTLVIYHFPTVLELRTAVMRAAVKSGALKVIAQGIVGGHRVAVGAPRELQTRALSSLNR